MRPDTELSVRVAESYHRYARAVDDDDLDAIDALIADDVCVVRGRDEFVGREQVLSLYRAHGDVPGQLSHHVVTNVEATLAEDGSIDARAYFTVTMVDDGGDVRVLIGRYTDRFTDVDGVLLLVHKRVDVRRAVRMAATVESFTGVEVSDSSRPLT